MSDVELLCAANAERRAFAEEVHMKYLAEQRKLRRDQREAKDEANMRLWKRAAKVGFWCFLVLAVVLVVTGQPLAAASSAAFSLVWKVLEKGL